MSDSFAGQRTIQEPILDEIANGRLTADQLEQVYAYMMQRIPSAGRKGISIKGDARFTAGHNVELNGDGYVDLSLIPLLAPSQISPQGAGSGLDADQLDGRSANQFVQQGVQAGGAWQWTVPIINILAGATVELSQTQGVLYMLNSGGGNNTGIFALYTTGVPATIYNAGITLTDTGTGICFFWNAATLKYNIKNRAAVTHSIGVAHMFRTSVAN